jgi:hypothetical protein
MHWSLAILLAILLAGCASSRAPASPHPIGSDPWSGGTRADAGVTATDLVDASPDAVPTVAAPAPPVATRCPPLANGATGPVGSSQLDVWRSRAELPACLERLVPADVDFSREMLAGAPPAYVFEIELRRPAKPPHRDASSLIIEEQAAFEACPPCRGVADRDAPPVKVQSTVLWRIPLVNGVTVFHRLQGHPHAGPCPPPTCG